ncbi:hypothetical protein AK830_g123 [Neonectria ditissima]|uniref:Uncharacterized protein n=1 Tax=Neonectria ditissima TaxID=78410 RepID=A0A0P7BYV4_9HYPO|nr:hypothetical protein AK830_g123 [Neonectria ditissima]
MGGFLSTECDCTGTIINETAKSITLAPTDANPDIAGIGAISAAATTAIITAIASIFLLGLKGFNLFSKSPEQIQQKAQENKTTLRHIAEAVLLTLSDQQLVIAPATLVTAGLKGNWCSLSAYHMNIVSYCAVLAIVTHLGSLVTQTHYFQYKAVGSFRAIMILCTVVLTAMFANNRTSTYFPTDKSNLQAGLAACLVSNNSTLWDNITDAEKTVVTSSGVIEFYFLCASYLVSLAIAFVHSRHIVHKGRHVTRQKVSFVLCVLVVLICIIILGITLHRLYTLRNWMINDSKLLNEGDSENEWGFGQLMPVFLLVVMTLYALLGAISDYWQERPLYHEKNPTRPENRRDDTDQELLKYPVQETGYYGNQGPQGYQSPQGYQAPYGNA